MQDEIKLKGVWYIPSRPEVKIAGDLHYSSETGVELTVYGDLNDGVDDLSFSIINGQTSDGKSATLYKCRQFQRGFSTNGEYTTEYDVTFLLIGEIFETAEELKFDRLNCRYKDFSNWLGDFGFKKIEFDHSSLEVFMEYQQPSNYKFKLTDDLEMQFNFLVTFPFTKRTAKFELSQNCEITFSSIGKEKIEDLLEWHYSFSHFLTLAYFGRAITMSLSLEIKSEEKERADFPKEVTVYYLGRKINQNEKERDHESQFLFRFPSIKANFEQIILKWFQVQNDIEPCIGALMETFMPSEQPLELKFLSLAHGIETYHRRRRNGFVDTPSVFKAKLDTIIKSVDDEYKSWLKEKLAFSNELTLQERLEQLVSDIPTPIHARLFKPSVSDFIKSIKQTRNYYTHYDKKTEKKALKGPELFKLTGRLKIFLLCLILKEIGFTDTEIENTILSKSVYLYNHIIARDEVTDYFRR